MARILFSLLFLFAAAFAAAQESFNGPRVALASRGLAALPADAGQFWMVYDLTPYTGLYPNLPNPEQTIVAWILQDTGKDFWFKEPFGVITADKNKLYVYHTAAVQQYVSNVLDRFMDAEKKKIVFRIQIFLLDSPDWRTKTASLLHPYPVGREEISGWVLAKSDVAAFLQTISKRPDYTELNASRSDVPNTELFGWVLPAQQRTYVRDTFRSPPPRRRDTSATYTKSTKATVSKRRRWSRPTASRPRSSFRAAPRSSKRPCPSP